MRRIVIGAVLVIVTLLSIVAGTKESGLHLPKNYRNWWHAKSMVLLQGHPLYKAFGGIHHVYVNDKGWKALRAGKVPYPEGSIFVFDLFEAPEDNNAITEGKRKVTAIMVKNSLKYKDTGGWGFQAFEGGNPDKPIVDDPVNQCFNCHLSQKDKDYVFTQFRD